MDEFRDNRIKYEQIPEDLKYKPNPNRVYKTPLYHRIANHNHYIRSQCDPQKKAKQEEYRLKHLYKKKLSNLENTKDLEEEYKRSLRYTELVKQQIDKNEAKEQMILDMENKLKKYERLNSKLEKLKLKQQIESISLSDDDEDEESDFE